MPRVRALQSFAGHKQGEEFELNDEEARILSTADLLGGQKVELVYQQSEMKATDDKFPDAIPQRGRYNRRDMRAKE